MYVGPETQNTTRSNTKFHKLFLIFKSILRRFEDISCSWMKFRLRSVTEVCCSVFA